MIVVDTSALLAIILGEPPRDACLDVLGTESDLKISAGTLVELFVAAERKGVGLEAERLAAELSPEVIPVTAETAHAALAAFRRYGKGRHPAQLNYGDCFSYAAASQFDCPLLFVGDDFRQTDLRSALPATP